jgi:hypothetical protein
MNKLEEFEKAKVAITKALAATNSLSMTESGLLDDIHLSLEKADKGINRFISTIKRGGKVY